MQVPPAEPMPPAASAPSGPEEPSALSPVQQEALGWFVRLRDEAATPADHAAFAAWLAQGPDHAVAFQRAERLWQRFDLLDDTMREGRRQRRPSRRAVLSGAAGLLLAGGGLWWASRPGRFADYATDVGQRRSFALPDGSQVELGAYSALDVAFGSDLRRVTLHYGEAYFTVTEEAARPFVVEAGPGRTRALGTRFDVKRLDGHVTVAVDEHAVEVRVGGGAPVALETGYQVSYDRDGVGAVTAADAETVQAWRRDRLVFADVPLRRVLAELERYRRGSILLADQRLGDIPVTAVFDARQSDQALRSLADTLQLSMVGAPGFVTVILSGG
ncbi:iron dicitrate transporter FecR [Azorhizobium oxalatiphilum]|uniref:Iron dicitrate transporter FecR n=1 Tax=Azorhizobium oxalatiphilum TaxID=980631 RepID=A0A917F7J0_9HYPH|nr:iron dicitrate transporter FecR [Azorhizobium oxalatiphilum]